VEGTQGGGGGEGGGRIGPKLSVYMSQRSVNTIGVELELAELATSLIGKGEGDMQQQGRIQVQHPESPAETRPNSYSSTASTVNTPRRNSPRTQLGRHTYI
jgi:hypothetical protein